MNDEENDGRFPDESEVRTPFPLPHQDHTVPRELWSWLPASVVQQCGPDEWQLVVEDDRVSFIEDGELVYPLVFRDASEIRKDAK
jgi:hypothetical protein